MHSLNTRVCLTSQLSPKLFPLSLQCGLTGEEIGVITPLRRQTLLIRESLQAITTQATSGCSQVEVNTVDKYQGRDKECIIVSFVRSNKKGNVS